MCGISGIIDKRNAPVAPERIRAMNDLIVHRGPDDEGFYFADNLALGHRRLSILDLTPRGHQPMCYMDRFWITYNGEIYNYLELREELRAAGYHFTTGTDTEVILAAYTHWGYECLSRFNGMWAFAIYDAVERTVFLARDRFGVKPLYYLDAATEFAFASETKQLLKLQQRVTANRRVVVESMLTYFEGHTEDTFFEGIKHLKQGHYMVYRLDSHAYAVSRYYELEAKPEHASLSLDEAVDRFRELLVDAIRIRLRSDVTVGTCLSGGLDSSTISAVAAGMFHAATGRRFAAIHAKSIEAPTDESAYARQVADHAGLELSIVEPGTDDFVNTIDELVYTQEEPFGSPSMFMGWHVFQEAKRRGCKVMLNGQGGDEVLLGYERYYAAFLNTLSGRSFLREVYLQSKHSRLGLIEALLYYVYFTNAAVRIHRLKRSSLLRRHIKSSHDFDYVRASARSFESPDQLQVFEISTLQLPHLLRYEDRNSMRHSIETRLPFLDYRVVEAGVSLRPDYKIRDGWTKYVLRRVAEADLPSEIVWRKNKLGFEAPQRTWLAAHEAAMKEEIARSRIIDEISDRRRLLDKFAGLSLGERWGYFNLAVWERIYNVEWA